MNVSKCGWFIALALAGCVHMTTPTPRADSGPNAPSPPSVAEVNANTIVLSFDTPTTYVGGAPIPIETLLRYHVYAGPRHATNKAEIAVVEITGATFSHVFPPGEVCFQIATEDAGTGVIGPLTQESETQGACYVVADPPPTRPSERWTINIEHSLPV